MAESDPVTRVWNSLSPKPSGFQLVVDGRNLIKYVALVMIMEGVLLA
jgi:hypothetical protein